MTIEGQKDFIFQILTRQLDRRSGCRLTTTTNQDTISFSFSQNAAFHSRPSNEPSVCYKDVHDRCLGWFILVTTLRFWWLTQNRRFSTLKSHQHDIITMTLSPSALQPHRLFVEVEQSKLFELFSIRRCLNALFWMLVLIIRPVFSN